MKTWFDLQEEMTGTASVAGAGDNPEKIVPVYIKKRKKDREKVLRRFIDNRAKSEAKMRERIEKSKICRKVLQNIDLTMSISDIE